MIKHLWVLKGNNHLWKKETFFFGQLSHCHLEVLYLLGLCCQWCLWLWCPWYGWVALKCKGLDFGQQVVYKACMEFLHPSQLEISFCLFRHQLVIWYFEKLHTAMILHDHNLFKGCSYNVWCGIGSSLHYRFLEVWTSVVLFGFPWSMWPLWTTICLKNQ
jgi:hypothetical protein